MKDAIEEAKTADIFVVIGTSLVVYPAAGLLEYVPATTPIWVIDPGEIDTYGIVGELHRIQKGASEGMKEFIEYIRETEADQSLDSAQN
jgi:NAD-dependent deacetylase